MAIHSQYDSMMAKVHSGLPVYLVDTFEEIAFRWVPSKMGGTTRLYAKSHGMPEYSLSANTNTFAEAVREANEITEDEYKKY